MKINKYVVLLYVTGLVLSFLYDWNVGLGFLSGVLTSWLNFYILKKGLGKGGRKAKSQLFSFIALNIRVIVSAIVLSGSIICRANPLGIFVGITFGLCGQVMTMFEMAGVSKKVC